jgi:hypothetical protein
VNLDELADSLFEIGWEQGDYRSRNWFHAGDYSISVHNRNQVSIYPGLDNAIELNRPIWSVTVPILLRDIKETG